MNLRKGFKEVSDRLKTDDAIQLLSMITVGILLMVPVIMLVNIVDDHYNTADAFMTFLAGLGFIGLGLWGVYEVTEAGKN